MLNNRWTSNKNIPDCVFCHTDQKYDLIEFKVSSWTVFADFAVNHEL